MTTKLTYCGSVIAEFGTDRGISIDDAIRLLGGVILHDTEPFDPNVEIDGVPYYYDDLDIVYDHDDDE